LDDQFKRAIELAPGYAMTYPWYAEYLSDVDRSDEAIQMVKKAQAIDPVSPIISTTLAKAHYFARRSGTSKDLLRGTLDLEPDHFWVHFRLAQAYLQDGSPKQAVEEMSQAVALSGRSTETLAGLAQAYAASGDRPGMEKVLAELEAQRGNRYVSSYGLAKVYASLPDRGQTLRWLTRACDERDPDMVELRMEPLFDTLHAEARFGELVQRVGLKK
jgi:predicted Zn-dependent protease